MKIYSLLELNSYIKRVIALNFDEPLWVRAEILKINKSRGHIYLELVQKIDHENDVNAQASAVIWSRQNQLISQKLDDPLDSYLQSGVEVSLLVEVSYHEIYGLKLSVLNIDPDYTMGQMEKNKLATLEKLKTYHLLDKNKITQV